MEQVTLIGKGGQSLISLVYHGHGINSNIFLLSSCFTFEGLIEIWVKHFPLAELFYLEGYLK